MRFAFILLALFVSAQPAAALTACPDLQVSVTFEAQSVALTTEGREALQAVYNRAIQCDAPAFTLFALGVDPLGRQRTARVRSDLMALGLPAATPMLIGISEAPPSEEAAAPDFILVNVSFDQ